MKKLALVALAGVAGMAAAQVIDQNQPDNSVYMAAFSQGDLAQSFQQSANNIVGAGIFLQPGIGSSDNVRISLWDKLPNAGGVMLASGSARGTAGTWVDVFWSQVNIAPNTTYFLVFDGNTSLGIAGSVNDPYSRGQVYANPGYQPFPTFDYTFRTYAVPEPASMIALGAGLAALVARRRSK
ncbi:MAG: PEP-CTERM sorting domain-containing protein [Fimbriimonadaceae bacterium]|nr:PEP-CTERM sorting domain-containing protein [Fimbriimonadaceae bacterium]QYK55089.1 MAG: PEP-CTERM sorting domain-containing protein [Fimbriimonadaceae bacterium]